MDRGCLNLELTKSEVSDYIKHTSPWTSVSDFTFSLRLRLCLCSGVWVPGFSRHNRFASRCTRTFAISWNYTQNAKSQKLNPPPHNFTHKISPHLLSWSPSFHKTNFHHLADSVCPDQGPSLSRHANDLSTSGEMGLDPNGTGRVQTSWDASDDSHVKFTPVSKPPEVGEPLSSTSIPSKRQ